jgi:hypothetical protein
VCIYIYISAEENIKKLQEYVNSNKDKLLAVAKKWEEQRIGLIEQYRNLKIQFKKCKEEADAKLEKIKEMRREMKTMIETAQKKEERYSTLLYFTLFSSLLFICGSLSFSFSLSLFLSFSFSLSLSLSLSNCYLTVF